MRNTLLEVNYLKTKLQRHWNTIWPLLGSVLPAAVGVSASVALTYNVYISCRCHSTTVMAPQSPVIIQHKLDMGHSAGCFTTNRKAVGNMNFANLV